MHPMGRRVTGVLNLRSNKVSQRWNKWDKHIEGEWVWRGCVKDGEKVTYWMFGVRGVKYQ